MTVSVVTILVILVVVALYAVVASARGKRQGRSALFSKFDLPPSEFRLMSTDLGKEAPKVFLSTRDIVGVADAMFRSRRRPLLVVGEAKSRQYRGRMRRREYYQMILYLGAAKRQFPRLNVTGRLSYADTVVPVEFSESVYRDLIAKVPELRSFLASHPRSYKR